ncbi:MAG: PTS sugar transporter subunit IIC, partial [Streptococcaceae bacterium]|nr:PTS sugar transporter subunit IIC [Streptococcaceae bacterium]
RTLSVVIVHQADRAAAKGSYSGVQLWHIVALIMQGLRIAIPAGLLLAVDPTVIQNALSSLPGWFTAGMQIGGGMVVAVGYAMVINMMASKEVWPFFFIGFALAPISQLTLIALGVIGVAFAFIYMNLEAKANAGGGSGSVGSGDPIGDILDDY